MRLIILVLFVTCVTFLTILLTILPCSSRTNSSSVAVSVSSGECIITAPSSSGCFSCLMYSGSCPSGTSISSMCSSPFSSMYFLLTIRLWVLVTFLVMIFLIFLPCSSVVTSSSDMASGSCPGEENELFCNVGKITSSLTPGCSPPRTCVLRNIVDLYELNSPLLLISEGDAPSINGILLTFTSSSTDLRKRRFLLS